jgi:5-methyltetrahydropteroyltriglutamate--homocysteine methyltransferase
VTLRWRGQAGAPAEAPSTTGGRVIGEKLRQLRRLTAHEASFLAQHAGGPFKVTMPAPSYIVARGYKPGITDKAYTSRAELVADVSRIVGAEVKALVDEGVRYIQLDNPHYPDYLDAERCQEWRTQGIDPDRALEEDIEGDNAALQGFDRDGLTLAMHICRGNGGQAGWHTEGSYEPIAEQVFGRIAVDRFLLEYDSARAGGFEPLRFMPAEKTVVLGLVTTKAGVLEAQDDLLRRIDEASRYIPLENLALSPQCGFASVMAGNPLTWDEQKRKLELVAETARRVWGPS